MADESLFRGILIFLDQLGIYDVVLPFLLVFAIVFAILEKTKVLGTEDIAGKKLTKKNLNAIVAFVISFMVVASGKLVQAISKVSANMVILLLASICFLILVGSFMKEGEGVALEGGWKYLFMAIMFIGLVLIFLNAFETKSGATWLEAGWTYLVSNWTSTSVASIILLVILVGGVFFITKSPASEKKKEEK